MEQTDGKSSQMLKGNQSLEWKKYHSILWIGRSGGKSFYSFGAFSWLLETFQSTFALCFVSNFYSPITEPCSPNTQLRLSITLTWTRFGIWRVKLGNWRAKLGFRRLKVGNKTESKSSLESFQQPWNAPNERKLFLPPLPVPLMLWYFFFIFHF